MRRNCMFVAVFGSVLTATAAFAADLPIRTAPPAPPPVPVFTWTGFYLGGYAGGVFASTKIHDPVAPSSDKSFSPTGFAAGGIAGYNYQLGTVVVGLEGDAGYNGWSKNSNYVNLGGLTRNAKAESSFAGRIRGRAGFAVDRFLLFVAGGVSFADDKITLARVPGPADSISKTWTGWNLGGGAEYAFTSNWIGRVEYIYDHFGKSTYGFQALPLSFDNRRITFNQSTVRGAVEYKF